MFMFCFMLDVAIRRRSGFMQSVRRTPGSPGLLERKIYCDVLKLDSCLKQPPDNLSRRRNLPTSRWFIRNPLLIKTASKTDSTCPPSGRSKRKHVSDVCIESICMNCLAIKVINLDGILWITTIEKTVAIIEKLDVGIILKLNFAYSKTRESVGLRVLCHGVCRGWFPTLL